MSSLDDMMSQQKDMVNRGYQLDQIHCAAMMLIAERMVILTTPIITHEPAKPKIGPSESRSLEEDETPSKVGLGGERDPAEGNDEIPPTGYVSPCCGAPEGAKHFSGCSDQNPLKPGGDIVKNPNDETPHFQRNPED
jgi:hypothetical protein